MASSGDAFTFIDPPISTHNDDPSNGDPPQLFPKYHNLTSAKLANVFIHLLSDLRSKYPSHIVTYVDPSSLNLLSFALTSGLATATLDITTDSIIRTKIWQLPFKRGSPGNLAEARTFAKYNYRFGEEEFIVYTVTLNYQTAQYVLKERGPGEEELGNSTATDTLLAQVGIWQHRERKAVYVYDLVWRLDEGLYQQMQKATWDKVILDPGMKKDLTSVSTRFFDSKNIYSDLGVPWKRGLIFYGPAGNGKTISIKALMHTLADRKDHIPTLYVKTAPRTFDIGRIFALARQMSPCLLILEDIDTIVTPITRSYFFNEVDGLENNDGILMVASTNHLDVLDPGLSKRPSRFDRKYLFPLPSKAERVQYVQFWREKLKKKPEVKFPGVLVEPIARITFDFSFAYIQEAFVSSLLDIAHRKNDDDDDEEDSDKDEEDSEEVMGGGGGDEEDLEKYELWRVIKVQVKILRGEMDTQKSDVAIPSTPAQEHIKYDEFPATSPKDGNLLYDLYSQSLQHPETDPFHTAAAVQATLDDLSTRFQGATLFQA